MQNKNKSNKKIALIIAGVIFLCLVIGIGGWYYYNHNSIKNASNSTQNTPNEPDGKPQTEAKEREKTEAAQNTSTSNNSSASLQITSATQDSANIDIGVMVSGAKAGTCTLKLQKSGQSDVVKTAPVGIVTNYYICRGFTVSKSEIPTKGEWKIVIQLTNSSMTGQTEGSIDVN